MNASRRRHRTLPIQAQPWQEVRDPETGRLLFLYNNKRRLIEIKLGRSGHKNRVLIDLTRFDD